jgi:hypothetical protein
LIEGAGIFGTSAGTKFTKVIDTSCSCSDDVRSYDLTPFDKCLKTSYNYDQSACKNILFS